MIFLIHQEPRVFAKPSDVVVGVWVNGKIQISDSVDKEDGRKANSMVRTEVAFFPDITTDR